MLAAVCTEITTLQECTHNYVICMRAYIYMLDQQFCYTQRKYKPRSVVNSLPWSVMTQSSYKNYRYSYTLLFLKRSHRCPLCPLWAGQEAKKAVVVSKCRQNFWTKRFQRNPHNAYVEISIESLMILNKVFSMKSTQCIHVHWNQHRKPNDTWFSMYKWGTCV